MTGDQAGVPLILDVGVMDMATCEPLFNALLAFWHCNATGSYFSFAACGLNNGRRILETKTISPSFYIQRAMRIHADNTRQFDFDRVAVQRSNDSLPVFTDWVPHANGTIKTGNLNSAGQLPFDETVSQEIMALEPYVGYTEIDHTTNDVNSVFSSGLANDYIPTIDIAPLDGEDTITKDMVGYITIGIDTESSPFLSGSVPPRKRRWRWCWRCPEWEPNRFFPVAARPRR